MQKATGTGRCYIFSEDYVSHPCEAAFASDIVIHNSLDAGTAGMECALTGIPTLLLDKNGWRKSQLYKAGKGKVVFNDLITLWDELNNHWNNKTNPDFGDWSLIINDLDPFRDGKATKRMSKYLSWIIECFNEGLDRGAALEVAANRYAKQWGNDKIQKISV